MTPSDPVTGSTTVTTAPLSQSGVRTASTIVLLAGIWYFVSPWVYGAFGQSSAWNSWIVGALIFILGCSRVARPARLAGLSWCNMVLGIWTFFSPWTYGYTGTQGRFVNSLCIGIIVFVLSIISASITVRTHSVPLQHA
jgi:putative Mn2+ efflux pump MntP